MISYIGGYNPTAPVNFEVMRLLSPQGIVKLVWGLILIAAVSVLAKYCKDHLPNKDDVKLREVEAIYAQLPIYPDFQEVNHNFSSKDVSASTGKYYASRANYSDVRSFYLERLPASGWQLTEERNMKDWWRDFGGRQLRFGKAPYSIIIDYGGDKEPDPDWIMQSPFNGNSHRTAKYRTLPRERV